ncbi:CesT family type III secretion system chaperone [Parendozoicomonas sp. Alg238-R29]|uniref:CesT family type III secretion system chaperone n=1 Tax=Parendozoicomonas sp. Alg238-R29 TaxID=2993446 RepID=UPI00248D44EA|nr:CesT family type III secretion system chaperone [Parendozoicomonas sp. Alg238-R29]
MTAIELLKNWVHVAGIDNAALDKSGRVCAFIFDNRLPVSIEAPAYSDDLFIVVEITPVGTGEVRRKRLEAAMQLNAYALETRGAVLGWDTVGERITLTYRTTAETTSAEQLDNMIGNIVEIADHLQPSLVMEQECARQEQVNNSMNLNLQAIQP